MLSRDVASVVFQCFCYEQKFVALCATNNAQALKKWVALRAPIFKNKDILKSCFQKACKDGHVRIVRLLSRFLTVDDMRAKNNEAFRDACYFGHLKIVKFLSRFLTVDDMRAENNEAFRNACLKGHLEIVKFLSRFLTVDDMHANNNAAFHLAKKYGHHEIVDLLSNLK